MKNIAIILSGGTGTRLGANIPKQYIEVQNKPIIMYCIETFAQMDDISEIVICLADEWIPFVDECIKRACISKPITYSRPGETRQFTIYNALNELKKYIYDDAIIVIHDAARPLVSKDLIRRCIQACEKSDGVLPYISVKDTLYQSKDGKSISSLLTRSEIVAGQAPEAFKYNKYIDVHNRLKYEEILQISGSTEIAYKMGLNVRLIKGEEINFKITTQEDLVNFKTILKK